MAAPTHLVDPELARALTHALARLRMSRTLNPEHDGEHTMCDLCSAQRRFDRLLERIPREGTP